MAETNTPSSSLPDVLRLLDSARAREAKVTIDPRGLTPEQREQVAIFVARQAPDEERDRLFDQFTRIPNAPVTIDFGHEIFRRGRDIESGPVERVFRQLFIRPLPGLRKIADPLANLAAGNDPGFLRTLISEGIRGTASPVGLLSLPVLPARGVSAAARATGLFPKAVRVAGSVVDPVGSAIAEGTRALGVPLERSIASSVLGPALRVPARALGESLADVAERIPVPRMLQERIAARIGNAPRNVLQALAPLHRLSPKERDILRGIRLGRLQGEMGAEEATQKLLKLPEGAAERIRLAIENPEQMAQLAPAERALAEPIRERFKALNVRISRSLRQVPVTGELPKETRDVLERFKRRFGRFGGSILYSDLEPPPVTRPRPIRPGGGTTAAARAMTMRRTGAESLTRVKLPGLVATPRSLAQQTTMAATLEATRRLVQESPEKVISPVLRAKTRAAQLRAELSGTGVRPATLRRQLRQVSREEREAAIREAMQKGYERVPDDPLKWGALAGSYVEPNLLSAFRSATATAANAPRYVQLMKGGLTVANLGVHLQNFFGNLTLLHASGVSPLRVDLWVKAIREIANRGPLYRYMLERGAFSLPPDAEAFRTASRIADQVLKTFDPKSGKNAADFALELAQRVQEQAKRGGGGGLLGQAAALYQNAETAAKVVKGLDVLERGGSLADASREAIKWIFDYGDVSDFIRWLRTSPLGLPFVTFPIKALPRMAEIAADHPEVFRMWRNVILAINAELAKENGWSLEDLNRVRREAFRTVRERTRSDVGFAQFAAELNVQMFLMGQLLSKEAQRRGESFNVFKFLPVASLLAPQQLAQGVAPVAQNVVKAVEAISKPAGEFPGIAPELAAAEKRRARLAAIRPILNLLAPLSPATAVLASPTAQSIVGAALPPGVRAEVFPETAPVVGPRRGSREMLLRTLVGAVRPVDPEIERIRRLQMMRGAVFDRRRMLREQRRLFGLRSPEEPAIIDVPPADRSGVM